MIKFNPRLYFRSVLCGWRNVDKYFLRPDMSSHAAENSGHVQPVVVFCCKHNVMMRILNKIQPILESNLDFQGFTKIIQTHPEIQPAVESWVNFVRATKRSQFFCAPEIFSVHTRKPQVNTTYTRIQSWFSGIYQHRPNAPQKRSATYGWIPGQVCTGN